MNKYQKNNYSDDKTNSEARNLRRWSKMTEAQLVAEVGVEKYLQIKREVAKMFKPLPVNDLPF